jgi:CheY-like chemotaxis protein
MVYGFVKQSGGHITIHSEVGHGTAVKIYLPRDRQAVAPVAADTQPAPAGGTETILLVEDNEQMRRAAVAQLASLGYRVIAATSGNAALAILDRHEQHLDLLFTDIVMPGKPDGYDLAILALERRPGIRIVLTSGFPGDAARHDDKRLAALALLGKPYRKAELARAIRTALESGPPRMDRPV